MSFNSRQNLSKPFFFFFQSALLRALGGSRTPERQMPSLIQAFLIVHCPVPWEADYPRKGRLGRGEAVKRKGTKRKCLGRTFPPRDPPGSWRRNISRGPWCPEARGREWNQAGSVTLYSFNQIRPPPEVNYGSRASCGAWVMTHL